MHLHPFSKRSRLLTIGIALAMLLLLVLPGMAFAHSNSGGGLFQQTNLVSDLAGEAKFTDPNLVNAWGISSGPGGPFWISDAGTSVSTLYNGQGQAQPLIVTIPPPSGGTFAGPTGTVFSSFPHSFVVSENGVSGASIFLFDTLSGTIAGWNPSVDTTHAITVVDNSQAGAVYTGLAIEGTRAGPLLYAANFGAGTIDVFDKNFAPVKLQGSFSDPAIPGGYTPFNIQNIGSKLYVMYARQDQLSGVGNGYVDVFDTNGNLIKSLISQSQLNLPWGVALAPAKFGQFSNDLLVGNFGDGRINAFNPKTGAFLGSLSDQNGQPLSINRLWALFFGTGGQGGKKNQLFFSAGIDEQQHGLFGFISAM